MNELNELEDEITHLFKKQLDIDGIDGIVSDLLSDLGEDEYINQELSKILHIIRNT